MVKRLFPDDTLHLSHTVLLYSSEIWVMMENVLEILEGFRHRATRRITWTMVTRGAGGGW